MKKLINQVNLSQSVFMFVLCRMSQPYLFTFLQYITAWPYGLIVHGFQMYPFGPKPKEK